MCHLFLSGNVPLFSPRQVLYTITLNPCEVPDFTRPVETTAIYVDYIRAGSGVAVDRLEERTYPPGGQ